MCKNAEDSSDPCEASGWVWFFSRRNRCRAEAIRSTTFRTTRYHQPLVSSRFWLPGSSFDQIRKHKRRFGPLTYQSPLIFPNNPFVADPSERTSFLIRNRIYWSGWIISRLENCPSATRIVLSNISEYPSSGESRGVWSSEDSSTGITAPPLPFPGNEIRTTDSRS